MPPDAEHPLHRSGLLRRTLPFAIAIGMPYALLPLTGGGDHDATLIVSSVVITLLLVAAVPMVPWSKRPRADAAILPLAYLASLAVLREGHPGGDYEVLVLLPALWSALYGTRIELIAVLAGAVILLVGPIIVEGGPKHPSGEWRTALIVAAAAIVAAIPVRRAAAESRQRAAELADSAERQRESRLFLRAVMESAAEGIVILDPGGVIEWLNHSAASMLGYERADLLDKPLHETVHHTKPDGSPYPARECPVRETLRTGATREVRDELFWRSDGSSFPVEYRSSQVAWGEGPKSVLVTFSDITRQREVERMKDEFISIVNHELRTPLTSIRGSLGLMEGGAFGDLPEEAQRMLGIAVQNTDRLVRLVADILDVERIESGRAPMERRSCDAADLVEQARELMEEPARTAGVTLDVEAEHLQLVADPDRTIQTLTNLIGNAIKFSPEGEHVSVRASRADDSLFVAVTDRGRGIPADHQERVFERFAQVDASDAREKGGTGLGLPIARSIVEQQGGRIWVESEPGEGATFCFTLPIEV